uniref:Symplekin (Trinotate prediction) n=1 Tax=Henneguya salminicola TaxID=69463 RepID=A0A6G3MDL7_HENSL
MDEIVDRIDNLLFTIENCDSYEQSSSFDQLCEVLVSNPSSITVYFKNLLRFFEIPELREKIIKFIETCCMMDFAILNESINFLIDIFIKCNEKIKSNIIKTIAKLYRVVMLTLFNELIDCAKSTILFQKFMEFCAHALLLAISDNTCIKIAVIKLCQAIILCGTDPPPKSNPLSFDLFHTKMLVNHHSVLNATVLRQFGVESLSTLKKMCIYPNLNYVSILHIMETARIIAICRPNLLFEIVAIFELLCRVLDRLKSTQLYTLNRLLKKQLFFCLRISRDRNTAHHIMNILQHALKISPQDINKIFNIDASMDPNIPPSSRKRKKTSSIDFNADTNLTPSWDSDEFSTSELSILKKCLKDESQCLEAAIQLNNKYFDRVLTPMLIADIIICGSLMLPDRIPHDFINLYSKHMQDMRTTDTRTDVIQMISHIFSQENIGYGVQRVHRFVAKFSKEKIKKTESKAELPQAVVSIAEPEPKLKNLDVVLETVKRILSMKPHYLSFSPYKQLYLSSITSIVLLNNDEITDYFVKHVCTNLDKNYELVLNFLFKCSIFSRENPKYIDLYCSIFNKILDLSKDKIKSNNINLFNIVCEAPDLPPDFLARLRSLSNVQETLNFGFKILVEMVKTYNTSFDWIGLLLEISLSDFKQSHNLAIGALINIYKEGDYVLRIDVICLISFIEISCRTFEIIIRFFQRVHEYDLDMLPIGNDLESFYSQIELLFHLLAYDHNHLNLFV